MLKVNMGSTKGKHTIIITDTDTKKKARYAWKPNIPINSYIEYHRNKAPKETIMAYLKRSQPTKRRVKKSSTSPKIQDAFKTKIKRSITIKDVTRNKHKIAEAVRKLIAPALRDKGLATILAEDQNIAKYRHRLELTYTVVGHPAIGREIDYRQKEPLATIRAIGNKTPLKATIELEHLEQEKILYVGGANTSTNIKNVKKQGYTYAHRQNGEISGLELTMTLR